MTLSYDVVVIGGGVIGSAIACTLAGDADFQGRVLVLEKDFTYRHAASSLSTSGLRQQFGSAVNVRLSQYTLRFLEDVEARLGLPGESSGIVFHRGGYLYLGDAGAVPAFQASNRVQQRLGVAARLLDRTELRERFPWLLGDDLAVGAFVGDSEGWLDGWLLMQAFRRKARALGVEYREAEAAGLETAAGRVTHVHLADGARVAAGHVVNAAGGQGREVAAWAGVALPVRRVKQMVFAFRSPARIAMPFTFTPDRLFFRPEGAPGEYLVGVGIGDVPDRDCDDFEVDHGLFEARIWPCLAARVAGFDQARLTGAWAGHYDMNRFDHNAIVGGVPGLENFWLANGFSGHGLMHSPGIGRAIADLIVHGAYRAMDLSELGFDRIALGRKVPETIQY